VSACPKCGAKGHGYTYFVQACTMEYTGNFGDPDGDELAEMHHSKSRPKTVVCNACKSRMTREQAHTQTTGKEQPNG